MSSSNSNQSPFSSFEPLFKDRAFGKPLTVISVTAESGKFEPDVKFKPKFQNLQLTPHKFNMFN